MNRYDRRAGKKQPQKYSDDQIQEVQEVLMNTQYALHAFVQAKRHPLLQPGPGSDVSISQVLMRAFYGASQADRLVPSWSVYLGSFEQVAAAMAGAEIEWIRQAATELEEAGVALFQETSEGLLMTMLPCRDLTALRNTNSTLDDDRFAMLQQLPFPPDVLEAVTLWDQRYVRH